MTVKKDLMENSPRVGPPRSGAGILFVEGTAVVSSGFFSSLLFPKK